jgi:hypothetical protein
MKVKDLKAELAKASEDMEVVVVLDIEDIKKIAKLGRGINNPGSGIMLTDPEGVGLLASDGSRPFEKIFELSVKEAIRKIK